MSTHEKITDFFQEDKRLNLKAVKDLNKLLRDVFADGPCPCIRCQESKGDESSYEHQHTFYRGDVVTHRRFAISTASDVHSALTKAWLAYTKEEIDPERPVDLSVVLKFADPTLHERLELLLNISGVVVEKDGELRLQKPQE